MKLKKIAFVKIALARKMLWITHFLPVIRGRIGQIDLLKVDYKNRVKMCDIR